MLSFNTEDKVIKPKVYINIGCLLDVPTATIVIGKKGESILNGGLGPITAIVGTGNNFKSTIMHYMTLAGVNRINESNIKTVACTYDTEMNTDIYRLIALNNNFEHTDKDIEKWWSVVDKSTISGNVWDKDILKPHIKDKQHKKYEVKLEWFTNSYKSKELSIYTPTFVEIDSISEFEGEVSNDMLSKDLDSSDTNTFAMKQGLFKTKFLSNLPTMAISGNVYFLLSAQLGEKLDMRTGPAAYTQPFKNLQYLKTGEHIKGVSPKFFFLIHNAWYAHTAKLLTNDTTKLPEYPLSSEDSQKTDLNIVTLTQLRGKHGPSGCTIPIIVSQTEGVLPTLTEFHYIKDNKRFGLDGNNIHYHLSIYPECSLSRTTVRSKINNDNRLKRAIQITAELLQLSIYHPDLKKDDLLCSPQELYEDIKKLGYDWNEILDTRGYWVIDQYTHKIPFCSTIDLLKIRKGLYKPYWKKKDIKK